MSKLNSVKPIDLSLLPVRPSGVFAGPRHEEETDLQELTGLVAKVGTAFDLFKAANNQRVDELKASVGDIDKELRALSVKFEAGRTAGGLPVLESRVSASDKKAFAHYCRTGQFNALSSTDNDPSGGFTVGETLDSEISYLARNASPLRSISRVVQAKGKYSKLVNLGTSSAVWRGERSPVTNTTGISYAEVSPPEGELTAQQYTTNWLLDDSSVDIANEIITDITAQFVESEDVAFVSGDGINKPMGFLSVPQVAVASWAFGKIGYVKSGDGSGFITPTTSASPVDCLIDLKNALHPIYRANAHWVMNSNTAGVCQKFKDADGRFVYSTSLVPGSPDTLLGYGIVIDENMPDIGSNETPIAFGDFGRGYLILDRFGTRILRDPYTSKGNTIFFATRRVGGCVLDSKAIRLLKIAS